jgi:hypothetical protein
MRLECIITGCELYDANQNRHTHGDLHKLGDVLIFNAVLDKDGDTLWQEGRPLTSKRTVAFLSAFGRRGIFVIHSEDAMFNQEATDYLK